MDAALEEELEKAHLERQGIVSKYRMGRNSENFINQWVRLLRGTVDSLIFYSPPTNRKIQTLGYSSRSTGDDKKVSLPQYLVAVNLFYFVDMDSSTLKSCHQISIRMRKK